MFEKDVERLLVKHIQQLGGMAYKFTSPGRRAVPDRVCLLPDGRIFFVELKAPGKKPTKLQLLEHKKIRAMGFEVLIIDHKDHVYAIS